MQQKRYRAEGKRQKDNTEARQYLPKKLIDGLNFFVKKYIDIAQQLAPPVYNSQIYIL